MIADDIHYVMGVLYAEAGLDICGEYEGKLSSIIRETRRLYGFQRIRKVIFGKLKRYRATF